MGPLSLNVSRPFLTLMVHNGTQCYLMVPNSTITTPTPIMVGPEDTELSGATSPDTSLERQTLSVPQINRFS